MENTETNEKYLHLDSRDDIFDHSAEPETFQERSDEKREEMEESQGITYGEHLETIKND